MRQFGTLIMSVIALALSGQITFAQIRGGGRTFDAVVEKIEAKFDRTDAKPGDKVKWTLTLEVAHGWHTYPAQQTNANAKEMVTKFVWPNDAILVPQGETKVLSDVVELSEPSLNLKYLACEGVVVFEQEFIVSDAAASGEQSFAPSAKLSVCDDHGCLPPKTLNPTATLKVVGGRASVPPVTPNNKTHEDTPNRTEYRAAMEAVLAQLQKPDTTVRTGLGAFILSGVLWGGISLLTPCVFPMIPITVSYFLKQSEKTHTKPLAMAVVYCGTIIAVLGAASLTLLGFFTALSINPVVNLLIGLLFVFLALSLFGMYDLTLPSFLTRYTSAREGRGGMVGTVFMALTFTIVSFTCVAPFLGGFGGMASSGQYSKFELVLGALAFSATFAAPFFFLALFPSMIRRLPKSGEWLHTVKVVMGFIELAAALKFFRSAELVRFSSANLFTYDLVLAMWVVLLALCGLFLFKLVHIGHYEEDAGVSVPRFLIGCLSLGLALYLTPGLFGGGPDGGKQRPRGSVFAWVDAFLLPDNSNSRTEEAKWSGDLIKAISDARASRAAGKPGYVFVDFTGIVCTNCRLNEHNVFTREEIQQLFKRFHLVQLYTDQVPDELYRGNLQKGAQRQERLASDAEVNKWFEDAAFGSNQLPLYVILEPLDREIRCVGVYDEGKINDVAAFTEFLKKPFNNATTVAER